MSSSLFRKFSFKREKEKQEAEEQVVPPETIQEEDKERGPGPRRVSQVRKASKLTKDVSFEHQDDQHATEKGTPRSKKRNSIKRTQSKKLIIATTCTQCLEQFKNPKTLPCNHTFCQECIRPFINPKNLAQCPSCQIEHQVRQGDPSWLDTSEAILRALDKARNIHLDQGQGQPGLAEDKKSNQGAMLSSSPPGSVVTCFDCNINLDSDSLSKYCLHCQKVYCSIDFDKHANVVREQQRAMVLKLEEFDTKIPALMSDIEKKLMEVESQADRLLEERMEKLKQERDQLKKELKEKRRTEQEKAEKVKDKAKWLLEMQNDFDLAKASGKDVVSHFSDCYPDFKLLMNAIDEMEKTKFEMLPDSFRLMDQKLMISRRASVTPAEQIEKRTTTPAKGRKLSQTGQQASSSPSPSVAILKGNVVKKIKVSSSMKAASARFCPWSGQLYICFPDSKCVQIFDSHGLLIHNIDKGNDKAELLFPVKVAFREQTKDVLILDKRLGYISIFSTVTNDFVGKIGAQGRQTSQFMNPCGLAFSKALDVAIVADTGNDRVQVLEMDGTFIRLLGGSIEKDKHDRLIKTVSNFTQPEDVAVSMDGTIVAIADTGNHQVRVYKITGEKVADIGMKGRGNAQFELPLCVELHPQDDQVIVGDTENNRIQVFTREGKFLKAITGFKKPLSLSSSGHHDGLTAVVENNSPAIIFVN